jgi:hypothetical protein
MGINTRRCDASLAKRVQPRRRRQPATGGGQRYIAKTLNSRHQILTAANSHVTKHLGKHSLEQKKRGAFEAPAFLFARKCRLVRVRFLCVTKCAVCIAARIN